MLALRAAAFDVSTMPWCSAEQCQPLLLPVGVAHLGHIIMWYACQLVRWQASWGVPAQRGGVQNCL